MVGMTGFEPATSSSQNWRATKLRYIPLSTMILYTNLLFLSISFFVLSAFASLQGFVHLLYKFHRTFAQSCVLCDILYGVA